jgi:hypothetical protein
MTIIEVDTTYKNRVINIGNNALVNLVMLSTKFLENKVLFVPSEIVLIRTYDRKTIKYVRFNENWIKQGK